MALKWYHKFEAILKTIWLIMLYGLDEAESKINAELEEQRKESKRLEGELHNANTASKTK